MVNKDVYLKMTLWKAKRCWRGNR